ncbi:F0F1 ATP synthase subunit gamma [Desulfovibrio ferrophilus]|uniref:ATP synthase gamma chain n=1 Tax=Desulfovibrio ferrophilus TaxID=241368 RepID=A0A2Z6B2B6_9BACT|nr:F0F1 ATP synthase subunit gamma [Desulfovibrio ferrophilus]BBD09659.1 F0F1 ATP synthase subunit gamma [Desulfovibrio ferrophilus]
MPSLKDVELKIHGVKKTKQITKAMNMVASAKLRSAQGKIERFKPYADKFYEMLGDLAGRADGGAHPLLEVRDEIKTSAIVLVTSDRGLCGSFNSNMIKLANKIATEKQAEGKEVKFYCIGKKGNAVFKKTDMEIIIGKNDAMGAFDFSLANEIGMDVINAYLAGDLDEVTLIFGEFISVAKQEAVSMTLLPMSSDASTEVEGADSGAEYIYEPDVEGLLAELLPRFIKVQMYRGMLSTSASEHAARMAAMDNATRACDDMVESLTLLYNKTRQTAITGELMDIVGGAEALKG